MKLDIKFENVFPFIINIIIFYNFLIPKLILLFLFILILKFQLKSLFSDWRIILAEKDPNKFFYLYKIKNFYFTWFWILIYFFVFIFLFLAFRVVRMGYKLDLNFIKQNYIYLYTLGEYLLILIFTLFIIIFLLTIILILKKVKTFLETYMLRKHLYLINYQTKKKFEPIVDIFYNPTYNRMYPENTQEEIEDRRKYKNKYLKNGFYKKIFYYFFFISYVNFIRLVMKIDRKFYLAFRKGTRYSKSEIFNFSRHFKIICNTKYNVIIPILIFFYELIFCNFTIVYLFYFLPFYFLYTLWYKLSSFWYLNRIANLDVILYELYYDFPHIMYLELDQEDLNMIFRYILGGLNSLPNSNNDDHSASYRLMHYKRFILYENKIYINKNTKESISKDEYQNLAKQQNH